MFAEICTIYRVVAKIAVATLILTSCRKEDDSQHFFRQKIMTIAERRCNSCHGISEQIYFGPDTPQENLFRWPVDQHGKFTSERAIVEVYRQWTTTTRINKRIFQPLDETATPEYSAILRYPMDTSLGHPQIFNSVNDPDYQEIHRWISKKLSSGQHQISLSSSQSYFIQHVVPVLQRKNCFGCHHLHSFSDLKLDAGHPYAPQRFSFSLHLKNYRAMLGNSTNLIASWGNVDQARQLLKNIPLSEGGIVHKGGNSFFRKNDPDYTVMAEWLNLVRKEMNVVNATKRDVVDDALIFVKRKTPMPERFFDVPSYLPGARLMLFQQGTLTDLTSRISESLVEKDPDVLDIRYPDISPDGMSVVFALRSGTNSSFDIWTMKIFELEKAKQISFSAASDIHFIEPLYLPPGPEPERGQWVVASSNMADKKKNTFNLFRFAVTEKESETANRQQFEQSLSQMTFSPTPSKRASWRSSGEIFFTSLRSGIQAQRPYYNGAIYRLHLDGSGYHVHGGNRSKIPLFTDNREFPSGAEVRIAQAPDSWWGGRLVFADHQLGVTIEDAQSNMDIHHSMNVFYPSMLTLTPDVSLHGLSHGGAYRDPCPDADGSILIAHAPEPMMLNDLNAHPQFDIWRLTPIFSFQTESGKTHGRYRKEKLALGPGHKYFPVSLKGKRHHRHSFSGNVWKLVPPKQEKIASTALLQISDVPLLATFMEKSVPQGVRRPFDDARFVRVIGYNNESTEKFVITEVPIEKDGSINTLIPARTPFDIQILNQQRQAMVSPHRWLFAAGEEVFSLSIPRKLFTQTCSGCHGALSGVPRSSIPVLDAVTSASKTMATWDSETLKMRAPHPLADETLFSRSRLISLVNSNCTSCHRSFDKKDSLQELARYTNQGEKFASKSKLLHILNGKDHGRHFQMNDYVLHEFTRWIDLGAQ